MGSNPTGRAGRWGRSRTRLRHQSSSNTRLDLRTLVQGFILSCTVEGRSPATIGFYREKLGNFLWYVDRYNLPKDARKITTEHIREFLAWLRSTTHRWDSNNPAANKPLSSATIKRYYACLRALFNWAVSEGVLPENPVLRIKPPKEPKKVIRPLSEEEIERLLAALSPGFEGEVPPSMPTVALLLAGNAFSCQ